MLFVRLLLSVVVMLFSCSLRGQAGGASLTGQVVTEKGHPVIGAIIQVSRPSIKGNSSAATDVDGHYVISGLQPGDNYEVKVELQGYATVVKKNVTVTLGGTNSLNFSFTPPNVPTTGTVRGSVTANNREATGVDILITDSRGNDISLKTDEHGQYELSGLTPGKYEIRAQLKGHKIQRKHVKLEENATQKVNFWFEPEKQEK